MDFGLQGKHAIVTGGSRGIGKAIALELARVGQLGVSAGRVMCCFETESHGAVLARAVLRRGAPTCLGARGSLGIRLLPPRPRARTARSTIVSSHRCPARG